MSLRTIAARAGTSHATFSAYENGRVDPTSAVLSRIVEAAGCSLEVTLLGRPQEFEGLTRGDELEAVLALAQQFPARHAPDLELPRFGHP